MKNANDFSRSIASYPTPIRLQMQSLRKRIHSLAAREGIDDLSNTVKWNEPAFVCKKGSTIRLGWSPADPDQIRIYFICNSRLLDTFRTLYPDDLRYEGSRAIVLDIGEAHDSPALDHCLRLALQYHNVKHMPLLGG